jgi:hypothetical protein
MGQTVALIHLHRVEQAAALKALDRVLTEWKYQRREVVPIPEAGPRELPLKTDTGPGQICYLVGPPRENWTTIIQAFEDREDAPFLADLSNRLSERLETHALAFLLHDSMVFFYNLDYRGTPRDGYNSNPQFFADARLTDSEVLHQRHQPKAFTPVLPKDVKIDELVTILNAGWWTAYDARELDETGEPTSEEALIDEEERATAVGTLLQLNGKAGYPFTRWRSSTAIEWPAFKAAYYQAKGRALPLV